MKKKTIRIGQYSLDLYPDDFLVMVKEDAGLLSDNEEIDPSEIPQWVAFPEAIWLTEGGGTLEESIRAGDAIRTSILNTFLTFLLYKKSRRSGIIDRRHSTNGHHLAVPDRRADGIFDRRIPRFVT